MLCCPLDIIDKQLRRSGHDPAIFKMLASLPMKIQSTRAMKLLFALGLVGLSPYALAASFDCNKAASATEKLICSDAETSALDSKLQQAYKTALAAASEAVDKEALAKEQRNWIKYTRGICQDSACLQKVYTDRIAVLARNDKNIVDSTPDNCIKPSSVGESKDNDCLNIIIYRDPNNRVDSFNQSLARQKLSSKIIGCSRLIDLPVGNANSNDSFGGLCILEDGVKRATVEICNADMTDKFQLQPISTQDTSDKQLINFTYTHCYGGP